MQPRRLILSVAATLISLLSAPLAVAAESELMSSVRQITFEGRRAGEGYFSSDGKRMVFQSERDPTNPFYQIYLTDLETGDIEKISPGHGKTTCAWIHPDGNRVLYASTQADSESAAKQKEELDLRASGKQRRYAWDYDKNFDLFAKDLQTGKFTKLTDATGYDAEGSYSPDGKLIAFASNRAAYSRSLSEREQQQFDIDPAFMNDIYIMNADGTNVRQLTDVPGYDGGPFFSPDGSRICWRLFSDKCATSDVYTMKIDGSDVQRLTEIGAMSWAPYYHPSGDYLIFTTNKHGFANFELYLVRADGKGQPVRVTDTDGFDGLPVFLGDGKRLSWTSNRTEAKRSQIFMADWNDDAARKLLGLDQASSSDDRLLALEAAKSSSPEFSPTDIMRHVDFLTRNDLGGRLTGTPGERRATAYVAAYLESLGFEPAGTDGSWFQEFDFPAGSELTDENVLQVNDKKLTIDKDWRPLAFSKTGQIAPADIVFAGYGMQVPKTEDTGEYDSYVHLNVAGQWVLVFRDLPQDITPEQRQQLARYSSPRRKATVARDMGAKGIIFVTGPTSKVKREILRFDDQGSHATVSIAAISISNEIASELFKAADEDLAEVQKELDDGSLALGYPLDATAAATIGIKRNRGTGRNIIARMNAGDEPSSTPALILGAHIDHLGRGGGSSSLAKDDEREQVHVGADDNASGVAAMLEIAQYLAAEKSSGRLKPKRDFVVAGWSGEELGLFGSKAFVDSFHQLYPHAPKSSAVEKKDAAASAHGAPTQSEPLTGAIAAYLNMDMVGRLREKLVIQGIGSSPGFASDVQRRNVPVGLKLQLDKTSTRLPTDASSFVGRDVPILSAFTGAHEDYHTPRDTPDKLNYEGAAKIARLFALVSRGILTADQPPKFELEEGDAPNDVPRARLTAYLGTIPDYVSGDIKGLKLSGVAADGPAAKAGVKGGDIVIKLAGKKVEDVYDYTYAIEALKIGEEIEMVVKRGDQDVTVKLTPTSRD
ncbi:MAG: M20/M25/M40 family metallo-hydrolase [Pirellulaceae bacterium]|nr:M20/M25/M40 family metallo-hydrolase [Pirellulaceae bacterium]